ncbi:unnamed protein product [Microthlaspi erraticum]|uniref:Arabidopsis retrotransposon Orf1 C-terminal domain-containing protein n=1 Tax=Microthlaspi erraticum TaxID=1685480 RepID=A0A6D2HQ67_9BRAS|nr:unnamed protein product [Microthlaspi erraticum]
MQTLRIDEDIDEMFQNLGIHQVMFQQYESYRKATCLFLATLEHEPCQLGKTTPHGSDGYITFWATGRRHYLSYRDIDRALFLPPGNRLGLDVDRDEMTALWGRSRLGSTSPQARSTLRSPPIRYFHKAIANTLFSRQATGNVTETEMAMIDVALTGIPLRLINGTELRGRRSHGGITVTLASQLRSYRDWASRNRTIRHKCTLRMAGLVTPLLHAVGFTPDREDEVAPAERLDLEYLRNSVFLQKTPGWTTIREGTNVEFNPPQSALYTGDRTTARDYATPQAKE